MSKLINTIALFLLAAGLAASSPAQDRDDRRDRDDHHDNGKHKGREKHGDRDDDERHDNGKHKGWYKDDYRGWDHEQARMVPGRAYPRGHYEHVREQFVARSIDYRTRSVVLYDRSNWVVAAYDVDRCRDWEWDRDRVYVYDDDHHPGWYLLFNARLGRTVHVEFSGIR